MRRFEFILTPEEYLEHVFFQFENSRSLRTIRIWLRLSVPLLIILLVLIFKIYLDFDLLIILIITVVLWFLIYSKVWKAVIKNKVSRMKTSILEKVKFVDTYVDFGSEDICVNSESFEQKYSVKGIEHFVLLDKILLIFVEKDVICLPRRLFENADPVNFITDLTKKVG